LTGTRNQKPVDSPRVAQQWQVEHGDAARAIGRLVMQAKQSKRRSYAAFNTAHVQLVKAWQLASGQGRLRPLYTERPVCAVSGLVETIGNACHV
jgi:hypothetical protein